MTTICMAKRFDILLHASIIVSKIIKKGLQENGMGHIEVIRVEGLADDLDGTRKIIARIIDLWSGETGGPYEED